MVTRSVRTNGTAQPHDAFATLLDGEGIAHKCRNRSIHVNVLNIQNTAVFIYKMLSYLRRAVLVNLCYVSRAMGITKISKQQK